jgi:hypothetical protein
MPHRPDWWDRYTDGRGLLMIAQDIHMNVVGSAEDDPKGVADDIGVLVYAVDNWVETTKFDDERLYRDTKKWDDKVLDLLLCAIIQGQIWCHSAGVSVPVLGK